MQKDLAQAFAISSAMACAAAKGSSAWLIGRPTTPMSASVADALA